MVGNTKMKIFEKFGNFFDRHMSAFFVLPGFIIMGIIILYPIFSNIYISFTDMHLLKGISRFVGLNNYLAIIKDPNFWHSLYITLLWTVGSLILQLIFGLVSALLLNSPGLKAKGAFRIAIFIPYTLPTVVVILLWSWMLHPIYGIANHLLLSIGVIDAYASWLGTATRALPTLIVINTWFGYPLMTLSILAGLQSIPEEFYEVAKIEGASYWQTFINVMLPSIKDIIITLIVLRTIWIFNAFDLVYLATGGGPGHATEILTVYGYRIGWNEYQLGKAAALSVILLVVILTLISFSTKVREEGEE